MCNMLTQANEMVLEPYKSSPHGPWHGSWLGILQILDLCKSQ